MFSRLPRDKIKLDRAFVAELRTVAPSQKVPRAPAALAKDLGIVCAVAGF
jgi:predicted signal transduction protein with EAL and GGDEF domain